MRPPLVCELLLAEELADHVTAFRTWVDTVGTLTADALVSSGTVDSCDELFDRRRWDTIVGTGGLPRPRTRRLSARSWAAITATDDLDGLIVTLHPLPRAPERPGNASHIWLESTWYRGYPNRVTFVLPARYCTHITTEWTQRLVDAFKALGSAAAGQTGYIGWTTPLQHLRHPLGVIDFTTTVMVMEPVWALLLRDGHLDRVGGLAAIRSSGLFAAVEPLTTQSGESLCYLQTSLELSPPGGADQYLDDARVTEFLRPVLLP